MKNEKIILVGGGGHCMSVIDVIEAEGKFEIAGIIDKKEKLGEKVLGYEILSTIDEIESLLARYNYFLITVGQIKSGSSRVELYTKIKQLGGQFPVIASPNAYISPHAEVGEGTVIFHHAFINAGAKIGVNNIINTSSIVEHSSIVGDFCHISTSAIVNGDCTVGSFTFIGSNAVIANGVNIADFNVVGAGTVVISDTIFGGLYVGNPAVMKNNFYPGGLNISNN